MPGTKVLSNFVLCNVQVTENYHHNIEERVSATAEGALKMQYSFCLLPSLSPSANT